MTAVTDTTSAAAAASSSSKSSGTSGSSSASASTGVNSATAETFLKLLVAQMQNQDPMNPMDNSQVTTQMAQINMVNGIDSLNTNVKSLSSQFTQMQALQGASLVGKDVIVEGNKLSISNGVGQGGFSLDAPADKVSVDIIDPTGKTVDTINLGAQAAGQNGFNWDASKATAADGYTFKVNATAGSAPLTPTPLMRDTVEAINTTGDTLTLELAKTGSVPYSQVQALN